MNVFCAPLTRCGLVNPPFALVGAVVRLFREQRARAVFVVEKQDEPVPEWWRVLTAAAEEVMELPTPNGQFRSADGWKDCTGRRARVMVALRVQF